MTTTPNRSFGGFRKYSNEQKTLRAKLDQLLKWTRDIKTNLMKQSCKILQTNNNNNSINRQIINQIHDDLDDYKRKFDREVGRIHDICDALTNNQTKNDNEENLRDEILEALRRSPTYSSLEQHIYDDTRPRIRVKPRERIHPGQKQTLRTALSTDTIKRKASQPIAIKLLDTSSMPGAKRRTQIDSFKRSRSFTNVEHTETQLGMDYIEEDESDVLWKPFGPKKAISHSDENITTNSSIEKPKSSSFNENNSSDEEFDIAWERRAKQKARKEGISVPSSKRTVHFSTSTTDPVDLIELDLDETTQDGLQQTKDQNNNTDKQQTETVNLNDNDDEDEEIIISDNSQIINDSDDEIIALSDDEIPKKSSISRKKPVWTASQIQITSENSQSQSLHNPYRVGIADPSLRSVFLPPPSKPPTVSGSDSGNQRSQGGNQRRQGGNQRSQGGNQRPQGGNRRTSSTRR